MMQQPTVKGVKRSIQREDELVSPKKPRLDGRNPSRGQPISLTTLPEKDSFELFHRIPIKALSELAIASKQMGKQVLDYLVSDEYANRAAMMLERPDSDTNEACKLIGLAIKKATFLFPVPLRLQYFHKFNDKLHSQIRAMNQTDKDEIPLSALEYTGQILNCFTQGWDYEETLKVFKSISFQFKLSSAMTQFLRDEPGQDLENEKSLRQHLRHLLLDSCPSDEDRAQWISAIAHKLSTQQLAKLLILLYGPLDENGNVTWNFAFVVRSFEHYTVDYNRLARVVGLLQHMPGWTVQMSLEVLVYISNTPNCWLLRSFAALLLPLNSLDSGVVFEYFSVLYKSDRMSTASLLLVLVLMISKHFKACSEEYFDMDTGEEEDHCGMNFVKLDKRCAFKLIYDIFNHPKLSDKRTAIINKFWDCFDDLGKDFAESAVHEEDAERSAESVQDFRALMSGWKDYMIFATNDRLDAMEPNTEVESD